MFAFYLPLLFLIALGHKLYRLQTIPMVYFINGLHQVGTFLSVRNRIEQVHLKHGHADNVAHDDTRLLVHDAWVIDLFDRSQCCIGNLNRVRGRCYKGANGRVSVLGQVFSESSATDEDRYGACSCILATKFVGTTAGEQSNGCFEGWQV